MELLYWTFTSMGIEGHTGIIPPCTIVQFVPQIRDFTWPQSDTLIAHSLFDCVQMRRNDRHHRAGQGCSDASESSEASPSTTL